MVQSLGGTYTYRGTDSDYDYNITPDDVFDVYSIVSPNEAPLLSMIQSQPCDNTHVDWLMHDIAMPTAVDSIATPEGDIDDQNIPERPRLQTQCTPITQAVKVTNRARQLKLYGASDPFWLELTDRMAHVIKQTEAQAWFGTYQLGVPNATPASGTAPRGAGLLDWAVTSGEGRANNVAWTVSPNGATDPKFGSYWLHPDAALSESGFIDVLQGAYEIGCPVQDTVIHTGPASKRIISAFNYTYSGSATTGTHDVQMSRVMQELNRRQTSMDFYKSDFGEVGIVINRYFNDTLLSARQYDNTASTSAADYWANVYGSDFFIGFVPSYVKMRYFRPFFYLPVPTTDDTVKGAVGVDFCVYPLNPKAIYGRSNIGGTHDSNTA